MNISFGCLYYLLKCVSACSVASAVSKSLWPRGLYPARLMHPWDSPGKNPGVGCYALLQGIFPTQGLILCLLHCRQIFFFFKLLSPQGSPPTPSFQSVKWINSSLRATSLHTGSRPSHLVVFLGIRTVWELYRSRTKSLPSKPLPLLRDLLTLIWSDRQESIEKLTGGA